MDTTIRRMLDEEYRQTLEEISRIQVDSEEGSWQLRKLEALHRQRMSEQKTADEAYLQMEELNLKKTETALKEEQLREGKKDRIVRIVLEGASLLVPAALSSYWMMKGLTFEQNGTFTSRTQQWLSSHLRLFRK